MICLHCGKELGCDIEPELLQGVSDSCRLMEELENERKNGPHKTTTGTNTLAKE